MVEAVGFERAGWIKNRTEGLSEVCMIDSAGVKLWGREWNKEYVCVLLHRNTAGTSTRPSTV